MFPIGLHKLNFTPSYHYCCSFLSPFVKNRSFLEALPSLISWVRLFPTAPALKVSLSSYTCSSSDLGCESGEQDIQLHPQIEERFSSVGLVLLVWTALSFVLYTRVLLGRSRDWQQTSTALFQQPELSLPSLLLVHRCPVLVVTSDLTGHSNSLCKWAQGTYWSDPSLCGGHNPTPKAEENVPIFTQFSFALDFQTNLSGSAFSPWELALMSLFYLGKMQTRKPFFFNLELCTLNLSLAILFASMKAMNTTYGRKYSIILIPK